MAEFGWDESWIGYLSAANVIGALFVLTAGIGLIRRLGGVRALQISLLLGAASLVLFNVPSLAVALLASSLIGLSNGAANPAGSEVLQRFTPPAHRNFVFSIKQAGVPLGGVVAGLAIPPLVEALRLAHRADRRRRRAGRRDAATLPFRSRIDPPRDADGGLAAGQLPLTDVDRAAARAVARAGAVAHVAGSAACWRGAGRAGSPSR